MLEVGRNAANVLGTRLEVACKLCIPGGRAVDHAIYSWNQPTSVLCAREPADGDFMLQCCRVLT